MYSFGTSVGTQSLKSAAEVWGFNGLEAMGVLGLRSSGGLRGLYRFEV